MRWRWAVVLASIAAAGLSACVGVQGRVAGGPEIASLPPKTAPVARLPLPPLSVLPEAEQGLVVEPRLAAVAERTAAEVPLAEPDVPLQLGLPEVGEVRRPVPALGARPVVLLLPPVPAPPPPVASRSVAPARPVVSSGAPGTASGSSAGASGAAASATSSSAQAGQGRMREIYARIGDNIEIGLDGLGFLFLGLPDRQVNGMTFTSRRVADGKTTFVFKALKLGTYDLDFQQQDNSSGKSVMESVRVHVVSDADFETAIRQSPSSAAESAGAAEARVLTPADLAYADRLAAIGKPAAAIAELMKGYREGNPELNDRLAVLYERTDDADAAEKYWKMNLGAPAPWGDKAVVGLARLAIARRDVEAWLGWQRQALAVTTEPIDNLLADAAALARERGEVGLGLDLLEEYARRYPEGPRIDEVSFFTAQLLEADSPYRDLRKARELYAALLAQYPESAHASEALARVRWLDQHVFLVR